MNATDTTIIQISSPLFSDENTLCFSAHAFGWGYCAFSLDRDTACEVLGAADHSNRQTLLAFALGQVKIREAVRRAMRPRCGERIRLTGADFIENESIASVQPD
ncbi:hypothetical protein [Paraburkholderia aromaticivorans]|uniref:hypothetical protein n=1 Tax=Paraburkholderia aromaticivorans TaxID=2026199 RepID=UPI0038BB2666